MKQKIVFLIDGIGAFVSALLLFILLIFFQEETGIPVAVLKILIVVAVCYFCFSMFCYFVIQKTLARRMLKVLIVLNFLYCAASLAVVLFFWNELAVPGKIYLLLEVLVLLFLIHFEKKQLDSFSYNIKS